MPDELTQICQRHGIQRLALFGSRLKGTARPDSDLDLLVEFEPERVPGLIGLSAIEIELTEAFGIKVDLRTAQELSSHFREEVLQQARVLYSAAQHIPNARTRAAMEESRTIMASRRARFSTAEALFASLEQGRDE